jgi:predicted PurR-regulated permease PerM
MNTPVEATRTLKESVVPFVAAMAVLYFGREFFVPLALAILLSFLLAPLVNRFERVRLGRAGSVLLAAALGFVAIGAIGYAVGGQVIDLANDLPKYQNNLHSKIAALKARKNTALSRATATLQDITKEIDSPANAAPQPGVSPPKQIATEEPTGGGGNALKVIQPMPVTVVHTAGNAFETVKTLIDPILSPLGTAGLVLIFAIFMLMEREDLRDRVIHLIGRGHLQETTQALNEAGHRVSRYLLAQLAVNFCFGIPIAIGLYFIGIPNALLWGLLAALLRFLPYIGAWIGSAFPIVLALAVSPSWMTPLLVLLLFGAIEIVVANFIEPWLYGSSTGLSPIAVIMAAAFWTWLWGATGLFLATPLTVCIAVLGKYIPSLTFLDVLLGDKPPIALEDRFYQRLLALDEDETASIAEDYLAKHNLTETFDELIIPALRLVDTDYQQGTLETSIRTRMLEIVRDLIADLSEERAPEAIAPTSTEQAAAICIPASDFGDEVIALMLLRVLAQQGVRATMFPTALLASEMVEQAAKAQTRLFCISLLPPGSIRQALYACKRLRDRIPDARLLVGMWGERIVHERRLQRFRRVKVSGILTTLRDMVKEIAATAAVAGTTNDPPASLRQPASLREALLAGEALRAGE